MADDTAPGMDVIISANLKSGKLRGINYKPGFCVVSRGETVTFKTEATDGQEPSILIVFPNGTPFAPGTHATFIVKCGESGSSTLTVGQEAERKSYHYVVALKVGEQALVDGGCPEIFVDM